MLPIQRGEKERGRKAGYGEAEPTHMLLHVWKFYYLEMTLYTERKEGEEGKLEMGRKENI